MKNIANTFLAIVLLVATTGITLNKHYCMGRLKSMALVVHADHCFEGEEEKMPCCKDVSEELKVEEFTTSAFDFDATPELYQLAIVSFVLLDIDDYDHQIDHPRYQNYTPPLPDRDIPVFHQSFLI